ncbi:MAG TPA: hypothetical protein VM305_07305 [Candidatus Limnocylindrales bacterium]|nr:hypothetical protein [Candidatus Limnocylindrales bacterium]
MELDALPAAFGDRAVPRAGNGPVRMALMALVMLTFGVGALAGSVLLGLQPASAAVVGVLLGLLAGVGLTLVRKERANQQR